MSVRVWNTRAPLEAGFESAWRARLGASPHAHFAYEPAFLLDEARQGRHAMAVLLDEGGRHGAMVLRESGAELISGWPWRWQALMENGGGPPVLGLSTDEGEWLWSHAERLSGGRRLRFHLPTHASNGMPWFLAGHTIVQSLARTEAEMWKALDGAKRRMVKRAQSRGFQIVETRDLELLRGFARLPRGVQRARHPADASIVPGPGEGWREWEHPWMLLLVAVREGVVEAGSGFGLGPAGTIDYRTNASTADSKKDGANVLLAWEALRIGHERGYRWLNWGGATRFKQEFGGERVEVTCRLGGGPLWLVPNLVDASARRARLTLGRWKRRRELGAATTHPAASVRRPAPGQVVASWRTREPLDPEFESAWKGVLAQASLVNFGFDSAYLAWEARHDRHAMAAVIEHQGRRGALVLRESAGGWVCGWPWRWLAAFADSTGEGSPVLAASDAIALFRLAELAAHGARVRCYLPVAPPPEVAGYEAGATIVQALDRSDEELLAAIHSSKRRMLRRAQQQGYAVVEGRTLDHFRNFAAIQQETFIRRGLRVQRDLGGMPEPGEDWREWELPWMWLLLAERDGRIESGLGDGVSVGSMLEGRTGASTTAGRRSGAFALLCYEEARRGRDRGYRWLNHGGDTPFKREIAGASVTRLVMHCWLGGGVRWILPNRSEAWARGMRSRVPAFLRTLRTSRGEPS